jgi:hypothetical protein
MPTRLFTFVQMELPWELGPADGRYLLRKHSAASDELEPEYVVVLSTVGAERRGLLARRTRTRRVGPEPEAAAVPVTRATVVDPVALSAESQAQAWLRELDPEREAQMATDVLNRVLFAHRIAGAAAHVHEVSPLQALVLRAGFGEGEHVAEGLWTSARELLLSDKRSHRRASVLRPQERLAAILSGRGGQLLCEELVLRARLDLDSGRLALAAIELERAYAAALAELGEEPREDLRERIEELRKLQPGVARAAHAVLPAETPAVAPSNGHPQPPSPSSPAPAPAVQGPLDASTSAPDTQTVRHALERVEAALRARTARGFTLR